VLTCGILSPLYFVSPNQINFLVPAILIAGKCGIQVVRDGLAGPIVVVSLFDAWPGLFAADGRFLVATRANGSAVTAENPVRPGEVVVLYGTGFGQTRPPMSDGLIPHYAAPTELRVDIVLDGKPVEKGVFYTGITPGYGGLYQVNLTLPIETGTNPEVVVWIGGQSSQPGVHLPVFVPEVIPPQPDPPPAR
jgi:uncharacterized protein (TIGR03437 family)